jgi:hypothetical protein
MTMRKHPHFFIPVFGVLLLFISPGRLDAQDKSVTVFEYLHVPETLKTGFLQRELSSGSHAAAAALKSRTISFWQLLEQVGGSDLSGSANFLRITTWPDVDKAANGTNTPFRDTGSRFTVTARFFLHDIGWEKRARATPDRDLNYVVMLYHNTDYADSLVAMEKNFWGPFIRQAMDADRTNQQAWGNAVVLAPLGEVIGWTTVSYDLFATLRDALMPYIDPSLPSPDAAYAMMKRLEKGRRAVVVYHSLKVVAGP